MSRFFPRTTVAWKLEEPSALRKLTLSIVEMAVLTGIVVRLLLAFALTGIASSDLVYLGGTYALAIVILCVMLTAHLGNYTLRHWTWRVPAFAAIEVGAEMATSLLLIALHREPMGSGRAEYGDWLGMAADTAIYRLVILSVFAVLLAGVVQVVRYALLRHDDRESTAAAIHDDYERRSGAHPKPEL